MIPMIGLMMGAYILTRCISLASRKGDRAEPLVVQIVAIITACVAALGIVFMIAGDSSIR